MNSKRGSEFIYGGIDKDKDGWRGEIIREIMATQIWHDYISWH